MDSLFECLYGNSEFLHCSDTDNDISDGDKGNTLCNKDESLLRYSNTCSFKKSFEFLSRATSSSDYLSSISTTDNDYPDIQNESNTYLDTRKDASYISNSESNSFKKYKFSSNSLSNSKTLVNHLVENENCARPPICVNNFDVCKIKENDKFCDLSNVQKGPFTSSQNTPSCRKRQFPNSKKVSHSRPRSSSFDESIQSIDSQNISLLKSKNCVQLASDTVSKSCKAQTAYKANAINLSNSLEKPQRKNRNEVIIDNKQSFNSLKKSHSIKASFNVKKAFISKEKNSGICYEEELFFECPTYCTLCNKDFKKKLSFLNHLKTKHRFSKSSNSRYVKQRTPFSCQHCYFVSNDVIKFICHLNIHKVLISCRKCHVHFQTLVEHDRHRLTSNCCKLYKCCICQKIVKHRQFEHHKRKMHENNNYSSQCSISFSSDSDLTLHCYAKHHLTMDNFDVDSLYRILPMRQCVYCLMFVAEAPFLPKHISKSHKSWHCKICDSFFDDCDLAIRHSYSHTDTLTILDKSVKGSLVDRNPITVPEIANHKTAEKTAQH